MHSSGHMQEKEAPMSKIFAFFFSKIGILDIREKKDSAMSIFKFFFLK